MNIYEEVGAFYEGYRGEKRIIGRSREGRDIFAMYTGGRAARAAFWAAACGRAAFWPPPGWSRCVT